MADEQTGMARKLVPDTAEAVWWCAYEIVQRKASGIGADFSRLAIAAADAAALAWIERFNVPNPHDLSAIKANLEKHHQKEK